MDVGWKMCGREFDITWVEGFRNGEASRARPPKKLWWSVHYDYVITTQLRPAGSHVTTLLVIKLEAWQSGTYPRNPWKRGSWRIGSWLWISPTPSHYLVLYWVCESRLQSICVIADKVHPQTDDVRTVHFLIADD